MNWSTIFSIGISLVNLIAVFMYIKVTNKGYKLRDDHIEFQWGVIKAQAAHIDKLENKVKVLIGRSSIQE